MSLEITDEDRFAERTCRVLIRRGEDWPVKPQAEQIDGAVFIFRPGWRIDEDDHDRYVGEWAMLPADLRQWLTFYPNAPTWIASGDLWELSDANVGQVLRPEPS